MICRNALAAALIVIALAWWPALGVADPPKLKSPAAELAVFDANGKRVGRFTLTHLLGGVVQFKIEGRWFALYAVNKSRLYGTWLYYASEDCTGPAYFLAPALEPLLPQTAVAPPGSTLYMEAPDPVVETIALKSFLSFPDICSRLLQNALPAEATAAIPFVNLDTLFSPPFRVGRDIR